MGDKELVERIKPWGLVLKDMLEACDKDLSEPGSVRMTFGEMIREFCGQRGLKYPPPDVESALLMTAFKRSAMGAPAPKGFA